MLNQVSLTERVSLRGRAKLAYGGLFAIGAIHVIAAATSTWVLVLIGQLKAGEPVDQGQIESVLRIASQLETAYWIGLVIAAATFIIWFDRAYKNVGNARPEGPAPGGAIFCWFIPIANLIAPYSVAVEIWTGSAPHPTDPNPRRGLWLVRVWWALWVISGLVGTILLRNAAAATLDEAEALQYRAVVINGLRVVAAVFAALVVKRITERQDAAMLAPARVVDAG